MRFALVFFSGVFAATAADWKSSLTFRASFDGGTDATVGKGDHKIYQAASWKEAASAKPGIAGLDIEIAKGAGKRGDALRFAKKNTKAVFYKAKDNVLFDPKGWSGTVSFWLSLDPNKDLEPGFSDPLQVTDDAYNDSAIWVDFSKDERPRLFRLGVFGDLKAWNPQDIPPDKNPAFNNRLVAVTQPPFAHGKWTHVGIVHRGLGSGKGTAELWLDGKKIGSSTIPEPFTWDLERASIRLGLSYVGLMDEILVFSKPLDAKHIQELAKGNW